MKELLLRCIMLLKVILTSTQELNYKVAVPEYICDKDGNVKEIQNDLTTIRFLGDDATNLTYSFNVKFKRIGNKCRNQQRCNLIAWRIVREFECYLKNYPGIEDGLLEFNNSMLMPGLKYILNIVIENNGVVIETKSMNLDFVDEDAREAVQKPMASILLLGSDKSYAYISYILNAETTICSNISDYYFSWELLDKANSLLQKFDNRASELRIPPNTFEGLNTYNINCELIDAVADSSVAKASQRVKVLEKGLAVKLPFRTMVTKLASPIRIKTYAVDLDNQSGEIKFFWSCLNGNNEDCKINSDTDELNIENGFNKLGTYEISLEASKGRFTQFTNCTVIIMEDVPSIEVEPFEFPVNPSTGVEVNVNLEGLQAFCSLQWNSVQVENYEVLDLTAVPGNVHQVFNISLSTDIFLDELEEFSNVTVARKHSLKIPPSGETWTGLKGDSKYMVRLTVSCPPLLEDFDGNDTLTDYLTEPVLGTPIVSYVDISLETNAAPVPQELEVQPTAGEALITVFNFKTSKALDKAQDSPILYKFGFVVKDTFAVFDMLCDVINTNTVLPYSNDGVSTFLEVCDNFNSCARILGTKITTSAPSRDISQRIIQNFRENINNDNFNKAFVNALSILSSYEELQDDYKKEEVLDSISDIIEARIAKQHQMELKNDYWTETSKELIKFIGDFNDKYPLTEDILNNLIQLRTELTELSSEYKRSTRTLLSVPQNLINLNEINNYLKLSELIITNSKDNERIFKEKNIVRTKIREYMTRLCRFLYEKGKSSFVPIESKALSLSATVETINLNRLKNYLTVPFNSNSWNITAKVKLLDDQKSLLKDNKYCVGRAGFKNFLPHIGNIYLIDVYNNNDEIVNSQLRSSIFLPREISDKTPKCIVFGENIDNKNSCRTEKLPLSYVSCSCNSLGYYFVEYDNLTIPPIGTITQTDRTTEVPPKTTTNSNELRTDDEAVPEPTSEFVELFENISISDKNTTKSQKLKPKRNVEVILYVLIAFAIFGISVLYMVLKRFPAPPTILEQYDLDDFDENKQYAKLQDGEMLG